MEIIKIEKKSDLIDYNKLKIPYNYVLVLPDNHHEFYHNDKGEEIDIQIGKSLYRDVADEDSELGRLEESVTNVAQHYSVKGKVYAVPNKLLFPIEKIKRLRRNFGNNNADLKKLGELISNTVEWDVPIEVEVGDDVVFDYLSHIGCYDDGRWIETELGDMYLIRYDELNLRITPSGEKQTLNGWMLVSKEAAPEKSETGLDLVYQNEDRITKQEFATVIDPGKPVLHYKDDFDYVDDPYEFKIGQKVKYRPGGTKPLEWVLHQTLYPGTKALLVHRRDIFYAIEDEQ